MAQKYQTEVEKAARKLESAVAAQAEFGSTIKRTDPGSGISVASDIPLRDAAQALISVVADLEEDSVHRVQMEGHVGDLLHCFFNAMKNTIGGIVATSEVVRTLFGSMKIPAAHVSVEVGYQQTQQYPIGKVEIPGLPIEIEIAAKEGSTPMAGIVRIDFRCKKKMAYMVKMLEEAWRTEYATRSLFIKATIDSDFHFLPPMPQEQIDKLVYSDNEMVQLEAQLFYYIREPDEVLRHGLSLRRLVLLSGPYGTGKSMTGLYVTHLAKEHGWTAILVKPGANFVEMLRFAKRYQPAILFVEDLDVVTDTDDAKGISFILNSVDSVLSKGSKVITVATTNNLQDIDSGMCRPGRIDFIIKMGEVDVHSVERLVRAYIKDVSLDKAINWENVYQSAKDYSPAFVCGAAQNALVYMLSRGDKEGTIGESDLIAALEGLKEQWKMAQRDHVIKQEPVGSAIERVITSSISKHVPLMLKNAMADGVFAYEPSDEEE